MMDRLFNWVSRHKKMCIVIMVCVFIIPLIIIHVLFKWKSRIYWIEAEWNAGDLLAYVGNILVLLGTLFLGYITLLLNDKAIKQNDKLIKMQHNTEKAIAVFKQSKPLVLFYKNDDPILPQRLDKDGIDINLDYITDDTRDIMIMEVYLSNITNNVITGMILETFDLVINDKKFSPINGLKDHIFAFVSEKGDKKLKIIITGLQTMLSDEQWNNMRMEFDIKCVISFVNIFNEITQVKYTTGAFASETKNKQGKIVYKIYNYDYKILE